MKKNNAIYYFKKLLQLFFIYFAMFILVFFSKEFSDGIKNGIKVSFNLIIPSLFIFMIFSNIIMNSNLKNIIALPFRFLGKYIFKINNNYLTIVILSLLGGYPIGAKLISYEVKNNNMSVKTAEKMLCYCVNCGPAFLITGVGLNIFNNNKIGIMLFISQIISCIIVGFLTNFFSREENIKQEKIIIKKGYSTSELIVNAVNDTIKAMVIVCGFIVAFSAFLPVIDIFMQSFNQNTRLLLQGFFEVTTGCSSLINISSHNAILLACIFTSFGGVCVHLQICAILKDTKIKLFKFFIFRIIYTSISFLIMKLFLYFNNDLINCISLDLKKQPQLNSVSPVATFFLILLCIILLFFSKKSDRIKGSK